MAPELNGQLGHPRRRRIPPQKRGYHGEKQHIDYILGDTKIAQLGVWSAMHTRSDHLPIRACIEAKSGEIIAFKRKAGPKLLGWTPTIAAACRLAGRWATVSADRLSAIQNTKAIR